MNTNKTEVYLGKTSTIKFKNRAKPIESRSNPETGFMCHTGHRLNALANSIRADNEKWYRDLKTGRPKKLNKGERLMLIVTEVAEAFEGERKGLMDDKLPHRPAPEVELADVVIWLLDYCGEHGYDIDGAIAEKRAFNRTRKDHTLAARRAAGGKKF